MCEYCKEEKPIIDELGKKIIIIENEMLIQRKIGNVFNCIRCDTTFNIDYCPMCGRKLSE